MKTSQIIIVVVIVAIIAIGGWFAYSHAHATATAAQQTASSTTQGNYARVNPGFAMGTIETLNGNSFTITLANGNTKNVDIMATTSILDYASASSTPTTLTPDQLNVGEQVFVMGSPNTDGSIDANTIRTGTLPARGQGGGRYHGQVPPPTAD